jgi:hypothetical protein
LAILTPYKSQVRLIQDALADAGRRRDASRSGGFGGGNQRIPGGSSSSSSGGGGSSGSSRGPAGSRPGDWRCGACGASNFASRHLCFKCSALVPPPSERAAAAEAAGASSNEWWARAEVSTVDGFQGREAEVTRAAANKTRAHNLNVRAHFCCF